MREATIRDARNRLTTLVHDAERGKPVRLTRRGKPVAVLLSDREYERLASSRQSKRSFMGFVKHWRREMIAKGIAFVTDDEVAGWRDRTRHSGRRPVAWDK
jgi:prevent-host-death family protein